MTDVVEDDQEVKQRQMDKLKELEKKFEDVMANQNWSELKTLEDESEDLYEKFRETDLYKEVCCHIVNDNELDDTKYVSCIQAKREKDQLIDAHNKKEEESKNNLDCVTKEFKQKLDEKAKDLQQNRNEMEGMRKEKDTKIDELETFISQKNEEFEDYKKNSNEIITDLNAKHDEENKSKEDEIKALKQKLSKTESKLAQEESNVYNLKDCFKSRQKSCRNTVKLLQNNKEWPLVLEIVNKGKED